MKIIISNGGFAILISLAVGCQRSSEIPNPHEKIETQGFRKLEQELQQKVQKFSNSTEIQVLAAGDSPKLSPDGKYIAFEGRGETGGYYIWVMDIDGNNLKKISCFGWDMAP